MPDEVIVYVDILTADLNETGEPVELKDVELHPKSWSWPDISRAATIHCSDTGYEYDTWEFSSEYK